MRHTSFVPPALGRVMIELALVPLAFVVTYAIAAHLNFSEQYVGWSAAYEETLDLDELPIALLVATVVLVWFSWRRWRDARLAESKVGELLHRNQLLLRQLLDLQEEERKRIAQDLHDDMGQYLNAIKTDATCIAISEELPPDAADLAHRIISHSDHIYRSARRMIHHLRPVALDDLGLAAALRHLIDTWRKPESDTRYELTIIGDIDHLQQRAAINTYRIIQEGLSNAARHACARNVSLEVLCDHDKINIYIKDNGRGIDVNVPHTGLGLVGMRERVEGAGGEFTLNSEPGRGVHIAAAMPV